jgi:hypothetical protein
MNFKNSLFTLALFLSLSTGAFSQLSISGFDALGAAPATSDLILITDVSDTTASANGTSKKLTVNELFSDPVFVGDISLRDSTTATSAKIYKTYTDASNGEWLSLDWATTNIATIKTTGNGTGAVTPRALRLESLNKRFLHQGGAGLYNTFLGNDSGNYSVSGEGNTGIGLQAAKGLTSGTYNTAIGIFALEDETTGSFSTAVGRSALASQNGATYNTAVGRQAGALLSTGSYNTILGALALDAETTGSSNIAIGHQALGNQNGVSGSVAIGHQAGLALFSGGQNTIVGYAALDAETTGANNVAFGFSALGGQNGATYNTAVGRSAGLLLSTGSNNTILGGLAGDNLTTGGSNIIIGASVDAQSATASGQISIGNLIFGTAVGTGTTASTGNVGIGVVAPITKLDVKGDVAVKNGTSAVEQTIYNTYTDASNYEGLEIGFKDSLNVATIKTTANGTGTVRPIVFATGGTERIRINANGKIGVGTTVPTYLYQQDTANGTENWIGVRQAAQALWSMGLKAGSGTFHVRSGNAGSEIDHMSITYTTGNVGIGDPTPSYKLDVAGDSIFGDNSNGIAIRFHDVHGGSVSAGIGSFSSNSSVKELAFYVASTTENQAMRINYLGNVGIGTTSPGSKLDVAGGVTLRDRSAMTLTAAQSKIWSQSGEMKVIDAAGNITTISPHPQELMDVLGVTGAAKTLGMDYTIPESGKAVAQPKARWLEWYVEIDHSTGQWEKKNFNSTITESGQSDTLIK